MMTRADCAFLYIFHRIGEGSRFAATITVGMAYDRCLSISVLFDDPILDLKTENGEPLERKWTLDSVSDSSIAKGIGMDHWSTLVKLFEAKKEYPGDKQ